jgi:hypothetical protein
MTCASSNPMRITGKTFTISKRLNRIHGKGLGARIRCPPQSKLQATALIYCQHHIGCFDDGIGFLAQG